MSSTADAAAIGAIPGLVTVHIWSSVRSVRDYNTRISKTKDWLQLGLLLTSVGATISLQK